MHGWSGSIPPPCPPPPTKPNARAPECQAEHSPELGTRGAGANEGSAGGGHRTGIGNCMLGFRGVQRPPRVRTLRWAKLVDPRSCRTSRRPRRGLTPAEVRAPGEPALQLEEAGPGRSAGRGLDAGRILGRGLGAGRGLAAVVLTQAAVQPRAQLGCAERSGVGWCSSRVRGRTAPGRAEAELGGAERNRLGRPPRCQRSAVRAR